MGKRAESSGSTRRGAVQIVVVVCIASSLIGCSMAESRTPAVGSEIMPTTAPSPTAVVLAQASPQPSTNDGQPAQASADPTQASAMPSAEIADQATPIPPPPTDIPEVQEPLPPLVLTREGDLWYSDGSGGPLLQLTTTGPNETIEDPAVSLDGQQVVYVQVNMPQSEDANPELSAALYVVNIDGTGLREVVAPEPGRLLIGPVWATEGSAIYAFTSTEEPTADGITEQRYRIVRIDLETGALEPLIEGGLDPAFSPDGSRMAFVQFGEDGYSLSLHVAAPDGSRAEELLGAEVFQSLYAPYFSPDGSQLVFSAVGGPVTDEQGYPVSTSDDKRSPLGQILALLEPPAAEAHGSHWEIWIINSDGSGLRSLTSIGGDLPKVAFSPDGSELIFMTNGGIYRMNIDGSDLRLIDPVGDSGGIDWVKE
jgi:Tol biopolymer transport system component